MKKFCLSIVFAGIFPSSVLGQPSLEDLSLLVASGSLQFTSLSGNGSSSGSSLDGVIQNTLSRSVRVKVNLIPPLYFRNENGSAQNMIATQVYLDGGSYYSEGDIGYIEIGPNTTQRLMIIAYCADFDKENPSASDSFSVSAIPRALVEIAWRIATFESENPNFNATIPAQVAIWLSQGDSAEEIQRKFSFSANDERLARQFLSQ